VTDPSEDADPLRQPLPLLVDQITVYVLKIVTTVFALLILKKIEPKEGGGS
jgi:hypothetical protein